MMVHTTTAAHTALLKPYCQSMVAPMASIAKKLTVEIAVLVTVQGDHLRTEAGA